MLQVPVEVTNFQPKADRSWKLQFTTQKELSGEEVKLLADNYMGLGYIVFSPNDDITVKDVPKETVEGTGKTPAQRLRSVLYVMWKQRGSKGVFENWYAEQMNKFIETVKSNLEPRE